MMGLYLHVGGMNFDMQEVKREWRAKAAIIDRLVVQVLGRMTHDLKPENQESLLAFVRFQNLSEAEQCGILERVFRLARVKREERAPERNIVSRTIQL